MQRPHIDHGKSVEELQLPAETSNVRKSRIAAQAWTETLDRHFSGASRNEGARQVLIRLCSRSTWISASKMQALVVRNAAESIACAWIPNTFYALGNIFSGKWYADQSRNELLVSNTVYAALGFCLVVFTSFLPMMMSLQFVGMRGRRPTLWFCIKRLARATRVYFAVTMLVMFGFSCFIAYLDSIAPEMFKFKLECYADNLFLLGYFTAISRAVKQIYYEETQQGSDRLLQKQQKPGRSKIVPAEITTTQHSTFTTFTAPPRQRPPKFWRAYLRGLPTTSIPFVAALFVHILSQLRIVDRGNTALSAFVIAGVVFKLMIQEFAKHYIFKKRVRSARVMCVLVGIPTVLIDTQTRIILLGTNNTKTAITGAIGMALIEITLRAVKAVLVMWKIRHHKVGRERKTASVLQRRAILEKFSRTTKVGTKPPSRPSNIPALNDFEMWHRQVQTFHASELNADMYAEYISIGCSASILFFYGNHPHYTLLRQSVNTDASGIDMMVWRVSQLQMMGWQIGLEVVVDYISIVLEMVIGIEFDHVKNLGSFLGALFMITAVMNITISIGYYLS